MTSKTLGHYTIVKKIGEGGMGAVYEGEDTRLLRHVAIKLVPSPQTPNDKERQRLIHEARMASAINHPNICTIYDVGQHASGYYIVMEHIQGQTFKEIIKRNGRCQKKKPQESMRSFAVRWPRHMKRESCIGTSSPTT